jgi:hypothetical protein
MRTRLLVFGVLAVLGILCVIWFYNNFEKVPVKEWVGASGEAQRRPFLAAQRFVQRMGLGAKELHGVPELDAVPVSGVLLMPNRRQALNRERLQQLVRWAERGGHLIVEAEYAGVPDPLLDLLGVKRVDGPSVSKPLRIELPRSDRILSVFLPGSAKLQLDEKDVRLRAGEQLVSFGRGRGVVTVTTSLSFARNRVLGANDHAEFFWYLAGLTPARELAVYWAPARLSLWEFLKANAAPALAAGALLLFLWLWSIAPRFGPVAPDAPPGRRRLLDHLRASGRYYWVKGLRSRLVVAARDAALRRIARAQPDFATAPPAERAARLATLTGTTSEESQKFLSAAGAMRGADFIKVTQQAQRVHSALEKGNK